MDARNVSEMTEEINATTMNKTNETSIVSEGIMSMAQYMMGSTIIYQIIMPLVAVLGIIANGTSLVILYKGKSVGAFIKYLTALTATDLLLLVTGILKSLILIVHNNVKPIGFVKALADLYFDIVVGSGLQRLSTALTTVIALERLLAVVYPLRYPRSVLKRNPNPIIACIVAIQLFLQVPSAIMFRVDHTPTTAGYGITPNWNTYTAETVRKFYLGVIVVVGNIAPLFIVLFSTIAIVVKLNKRRGVNNSSGGDTNRSGIIEKDRMTAVLIGIAVVLITCMSLTTIIHGVSASKGAFYNREIASIKMLIDGTILLICVNSACNCVIYVTASTTFRRRFLDQLKICCLKKGNDSITTNENGVRNMELCGQGTNQVTASKDVH